MSITEKVDEIPLIALYIIVACFVTFLFLSTFFLQKDFLMFGDEQPMDDFLASLSSEIFGIDYRDYFLYSIPFILLFLYVVIRIGGWLVELDEDIEFNGKKYVAFILILVMLPGVVNGVIYVLTGILFIGHSRNLFLLGVILMLVYIVLVGWEQRKG